jgi:hypothetical protein
MELFQSSHKEDEEVHRGYYLRKFIGYLPTFSLAAEAHIREVEAESTYRCWLELHKLFALTCSEIAEYGSRIIFEVSQFFGPIIDRAAAVYDAVAEEILKEFNIHVPNGDHYSFLVTIVVMIFQIRDDLLPEQFKQSGVDARPWAARPLTSPISASNLLQLAWEMFDHPLWDQLDARMREVLKRIDDPEDNCFRELVVSLRKRLTLRACYWEAAAAQTWFAELAAADENEAIGQETSVADDGAESSPHMHEMESARVLRAAPPSIGGKHVAHSATRSSPLSSRDKEIHDVVGGERFRTLTNAEIKKDGSVKNRLRLEFKLKSGDAVKRCLDRIRQGKGYPLSGEIKKKRSTRN